MPGLPLELELLLDELLEVELLLELDELLELEELELLLDEELEELELGTSAGGVPL